MRRALLAVLVLALLAVLYLLATRDPADLVPPGPGDVSRSADESPAGPTADVPAADAARPDEAPFEGGIRGVVLRGGVPTAARITIAVRGDDDATGEFRAAGAAGPDGRFVVAPLALGPYEVRAVSADGHLAAIRRWLSDEVRWPFVELRIPDGDLVLRGRAVYADGRPFCGRVGAIRVRDRGWRLDFRPAVETDADGRFEIGGLDPGFYRPTARGEGLDAAGPAWRVPREGEIEYVVDAGLTPVTGRVLSAADDGPIAGAVVMQGEECEPTLGARSRFLLRSVSDANGRFRAYAELLPAEVTAEGYWPETASGSDGGEELIVRLSPESGAAERVDLAVRVVTEDGAPAAGAVVRARGMRVATGGDGRCTLTGLPRWRLSLFVLGGGWVSKELTTHQGLSLAALVAGLDADPAPAETTRVAVRAGAVHGRVVDEAGAPIAGAAVQLVRRWRPPHEHRGWYDVSGADAGAMAVSDADGAFVLGDLIPGLAYEVRLRAEGGAIVATERVKVEVGETREIEFVRGPDRFVDVRVVFADTGEPVPGAVIRPDTPDYTRCIADANGRARVGPLPPGDVPFGVEHDTIAEDRKGGVFPAEGDAAMEVRVGRGHFVGGTVCGPDGRPVAGANVSIQWSSESGGGGDRGDIGTDAEGHFRIASIPTADRAQIGAWFAEGKQHLTATVPARLDRDDHVLRLEPYVEPAARGLEVKLIAPDGRPVPRATMFAWSWDDRTGRGLRSQQFVRRAWFREANVMKAWVEVFGASLERKPFGPALAGPLEEREGELTIRLPVPVAVSGRVTDAAGKPVEGATVEAHPVWPSFPEARRGPPHASAETAADGTFRLEGLGAIGYDLRAEVPVPWAPPAPVRTKGGATGVAIRLRKAVEPTITVRDWRGNVPPRAWVRIRRGDEVVFTGTPDEKGVVRPGRLDPEERYRLEIGVHSPDDPLVPVRENAWKPANAEFRLARGFAVAGTVRDGKGDPTFLVTVWVRPAGTEEWQWARVARNGTFRAELLPEGPVELKAVPHGADREDPAIPVVTAVAGDESVELRLE